MVDTQHFCLRWNNYQSSITSAFENLRDDEDFVDVTLACDGRSLKAHRVVLSACSPYFRELLKSTPCKHPVIVLQDVAFTDLHALVEFIYHGEVNVHQRSLSSFLKTAEVLRVSGLTQQQAEETHNLAQVQSMAQNGGRTPLNHHQSFTDKLVEEALFPQGASSPPHNLNNLHNQSGNNNNTLSTNNNNPNSNNNNLKDTINLTTNGNGGGSLGSSTDKESLTPSPPARSTDDVKTEPMELVSSNLNPDNDHSNDSVVDHDMHSSNNDMKALSSPHDDDLDGSLHNHQPQFLMSPEAKLFQNHPGSFNFQMAALAADPAALASSQNSNVVSPTQLSSSQHQQHTPLRMPPPTSGGINEPQECPYCRRTFSCYYSLKRHFQDKHEQSDTLYVCEFCHRRYRTKNSLTTHKSLQHRGSSGMLKRLLKTSAIKNVLGPHHGQSHQRPHLFDFAAELAQQPPGIQ
ncbi:unnamed protein product [Diamesa hyperborea]